MFVQETARLEPGSSCVAQSLYLSFPCAVTAGTGLCFLPAVQNTEQQSPCWASTARVAEVILCCCSYELVYEVEQLPTK